MLVDDEIIEGCMAGKRNAQSALYHRYAGVMMAICLRYTQNREEAEDILSEAFLKIFSNIRTYRKEGSFEGWMKRIMINHALNHYRKNRRSPFLEDIEEINETEIIRDHESNAEHAPVPPEVLTHLIQNLPRGYRIVFNLFVFEEYSHKEISQMLQITESTSKTQLLKARKLLRRKLVEMNMIRASEQDKE